MAACVITVVIPTTLFAVMRESARMQGVQSPVIPVVAELIRQHPGTISLGQGVVGYGPPPQILEEIAHFHRDSENHKYKAVQGLEPLRFMLAEKLNRENGIRVHEGSQVVVTAGGNMGFVNALLAIADPGDEVIIQTPYYFNHEMAISIAGCRAILVPTDSEYQLRPGSIRQAITPRTRAVVTISPNNPTGAVYAESALREVNEMCCGQGIYHIHDEAYEYFLYEGARHFSPGSIPGSAAHTISLFSLSKAYGFASWRIGYMVLPEHLMNAVRKIQDTILICAPVISQFAAMGALRAGVDYCRQGLKEIAATRAGVLQALEEVRDLCTWPQARGAFYFLLRIHTGMGAMELVEQLIKKFGVAVIPGDAFGMHDGCYVRIAYGSLRPETAADGIGRFVRGIKALAAAG